MDGLVSVRRWLLGVLVLGIGGTATDLLLLAHYEDAWQWPPLVLLGAALLGVAWHLTSGGRASLRALEAIMVLFLLAGVAGVALHGSGSAEFQREIDPSQESWTMMLKVARAKAPPLLAPGVMIMLGLIGLAYTRNSRTEP